MRDESPQQRSSPVPVITLKMCIKISCIISVTSLSHEETDQEPDLLWKPQRHENPELVIRKLKITKLKPKEVYVKSRKMSSCNTLPLWPIVTCHGPTEEGISSVPNKHILNHGFRNPRRMDSVAHWTSPSQNYCKRQALLICYLVVTSKQQKNSVGSL